jgi:hypothetical protein
VNKLAQGSIFSEYCFIPCPYSIKWPNFSHLSSRVGTTGPSRNSVALCPKGNKNALSFVLVLSHSREFPKSNSNYDATSSFSIHCLLMIPPRDSVLSETLAGSLFSSLFFCILLCITELTMSCSADRLQYNKLIKKFSVITVHNHVIIH